jgi:hypothetical protein
MENASPKIQGGDMVMINTGYHRLWGDTDEYSRTGLVPMLRPPMGHRPQVQNWSVTAARPMIIPSPPSREPWAWAHTSPPHRRVEAGACRPDPLEAFPYWEPAHKKLMCEGGIRASRTWAATWMRSPASAAPFWCCPGVGPAATAASCNPCHRRSEAGVHLLLPASSM